MNIAITVTSNRSSRRFVGKIHRACKQQDLLLDLNSFYIKYGKTIPDCVTHEVEIVKPLFSEEEKSKFHAHDSLITGTAFFCYPFRIPTPERACELFKIWCLGVVLTTETNTDLNTVYSLECRDDAQKFCIILRERFNIRITEMRID